MAAVTGFCVRCKTQRELQDAKEITMKNGRKAMKGKCKECGTQVFKIMSSK